MSLIYDALRQRNALPAQPIAAGARAAPPAARASTRRTPLIWGSALTAGVLASGLFYAMAPAPAAPLPIIAAPAVVKTASAMVATSVPVSIAPALQTAQIAQVQTVSPPPAAPLQAPSPPAAIPAQPTVPLAITTHGARAAASENIVDVQSEQLSITVSRRDNNSSPSSATPLTSSTTSAAQIPALIKSLEAAVAQGDATAIDARLATLRSQLPGDSVTLLRTEAWIAHTRGDLVAAEEGYRQILARIADDEQAGVNLALLEAGRGDADGAQTRLRRLAAENGNSALIGRALAQLQGTPP